MPELGVRISAMPFAASFSARGIALDCFHAIFGSIESATEFQLHRALVLARNREPVVLHGRSRDRHSGHGMMRNEPQRVARIGLGPDQGVGVPDDQLPLTAERTEQ
jgi:hypothetical protein